jgi:hypothetical protein
LTKSASSTPAVWLFVLELCPAFEEPPPPVPLLPLLLLDEPGDVGAGGGPPEFAASSCP